MRKDCIMEPTPECNPPNLACLKSNIKKDSKGEGEEAKDKKKYTPPSIFSPQFNLLENDSIGIWGSKLQGATIYDCLNSQEG